jgi:hypothetical protein
MKIEVHFKLNPANLGPTPILDRDHAEVLWLANTISRGAGLSFDELYGSIEKLAAQALRLAAVYCSRPAV